MTFIINATGFLLLSIVIAYKGKKQIVQALPVSTAVLVSVLLLLGMIRALSLIDVIWIAVVVILAIYCVFKRNSIDRTRIQEMLTDPSFFTMIIFSVIVYFFVRGRVVASWDELGCWGLEAKTLYFVDGFNHTGMHTSIGYSDYFPGQMLFVWWAAHMQRAYFHEGLLYVGYYLFYYFIIAGDLLECLSVHNGKNKLVRIFWGIVVSVFMLLLPAVFCVFEYEMLSVELLQSALMGVMILQMYRDSVKEKGSTFDLIRWVSLSLLLISMKDSSIFFMAMICLWGMIMSIISKKRYLTFSMFAAGAFGSLFFAVIWKGFVNISERGNVGSRSKGILHGIKEIFVNPNEQYASESMGYVSSFIESIKQYPLHLTRGMRIDLSLKGLLLLMMICFIALYSRRIFKMTKKEAVASVVCAEGIAVIYLLVVLCMHIFFFRETQYLDAYVMMMSISRYCEPVFLGIVLFFSLAFLTYGSWRDQLIVLACIFLTTGFAKAGEGLWNYRAIVEKELGEREECIVKYDGLFGGISEYGDLTEGRVLYICDYSDEIFKDHRHIRYLMAPKAITFYYIDPMADDHGYIDDIVSQMDQGLYEYYYIETRGKLGDDLELENGVLYTATEVAEKRGEFTR